MKTKATTLLERARHFRKNPTHGEALLWGALRNRSLGVRFYRQHVVGPFIADFVCLSARLIVEVDGPIHAATRGRDEARDEWLTISGYRILRVVSAEVEHHIESVLLAIRAQLDASE
jgi:very-short-patch-repair endonuclease